MHPTSFDTILFAHDRPAEIPRGRLQVIHPQPSGGAIVAMLDKVAEASLIWRWGSNPLQMQRYDPPQPGRMIRLTPMPNGHLLSATGRCGEGYAEVRLWSDPQEGTMSIARVPGRLLWAPHDPTATMLVVDREGGIVQTSFVEGQPTQRWDTRLFESKRWDPFVPRPVASADGRRVFMVREGQTIAVLAVDDATPKTLVTVDDELTRLMLHPDGVRLVTASFDDNVRVWDARSGELLATLAGGDRTVVADALRLSPDGSMLFVGYDDTTYGIWDMKQYQRRATLPMPNNDTEVHGETRLVRFHCDGIHVMASHQNHVLHVWNAVHGTHVATWQGTDPITTCQSDDKGRVWVGDIEARVTVLAGTSDPTGIQAL
ncbi:MAG: hypothetical protein AAFS10_17965 [Myxococcota bacterium]